MFQFTLRELMLVTFLIAVCCAVVASGNIVMMIVGAGLVVLGLSCLRGDPGHVWIVAFILDGFIAGPHEEGDWILMDPELDFEAFYSDFDTMLMGRRTFEWMKRAGGGASMPGMQVYVCSRTLRQEDHPGVAIVNNLEELLAELRSKPGKDVWLFSKIVAYRTNH